MRQAYLDSIVLELKKRKEIVFAYLFGSLAKRKETGLSDVDIACYLKKEISKENYFDFRLSLIGELTRLMPNQKKLDLIILNQAPPLLAYEVARSGKLLFSCDEKKRIPVIAGIYMNYLDTKYIRNIEKEALFNRIERNEYGHLARRHPITPQKIGTMLSKTS